VTLDGSAASVDSTISIYYRGSGFLKFHNNANANLSLGSQSDYVRISSTGLSASAQLRIQINATGTEEIYFLLPQLEEGSAVTSPIITAGTTATRAADDITWPLTGNFNQDQGMAFITVTLGAASADFAGGDRDILGLFTTSSGDILTVSNAGAQYAYDGTTFCNAPAGALTADTAYKFCTRWNTKENTYQVIRGGSAGTGVAYDGGFRTDGSGTIQIAPKTDVERFWIKNIRILSVDRGQSYGEEQTQ
jgi:hypothetical protein